MSIMELLKQVGGDDLRSALKELVEEYDVTILPCGPDKRPRTDLVGAWKDLQQRPNNEIELAHWFKNHDGYWGAVTGKNFNVIDIDSYKDDSLKPWVVENLPPSPLKAISRSGGEHRYYATDPELDLPTGQFNGIDTRGKGGYIIIAGPGYQLSWESDEDFWKFEDLPTLGVQHLAALQARKQVVKKEASGDWHERMLQYTSKAVARGDSDEKILADYKEWTEAGYSHEQTLREMKTAIQGARDKGWAPTEDRPIPVRGISDAFDMETDKPQEFLGKGFIAAGFRIFLIGAPKIGKSQFVLEMLSTAAVGGEFLGYRWDKPHRVLWLQAEIRGPYVGVRLRPLFDSFSEQQQQLLRRNFLWTDRGDIDLAENFNRLRDLIKVIKPSIIAVDPMANFFTGDESNNAEVNNFLKKLNSLTDEKQLNLTTPPAVVLVHHTRKGARDTDGFEGARGASSLSGWMDTGLMLTKHEDGTKLSFMLRNGKWPRDRVMKMNTETLRFEEVE